MLGTKYIANSADLKAASVLVPVGKVIVTSDDVNAVCEFMIGGTNGTTVAMAAVPTANTTIVVDLVGTLADYVNLTNAVVNVELL